ncbi:hypothetical protein [Sphingomicrobium sediminis]|uniref:Uncharacterized protein n=1 Tax=Sphingomicrobium sediminis TaxID=2950949 RepID=A0A9X2EGU7_9SPHN|nr:hypothetical protein [Sphingomicrobium sediminis]MCM8557773.1 hypothetical protein [Sphingomicrobium sediminis]
MPYRHAHWWVLACFGVILLGFWPSYWSVATTSPWPFHLHGIVATVWVLMVAAQVWTIHKKKRGLHRATGQASLYLFPFLIMGLTAIGARNAQGYATDPGPVSAMFGESFLLGLWIAVAAYVVLFYRAMKYRRKVWVHSAYLLGTPVILFESPAGRAMNGFVPGLQIRGPEDFGHVLDGILVSDALMVALCLVLWWRAKKHSNAWGVVAAFVAAQMVLMYGAYHWWSIESWVMAAATIPMPVMLAFGFILGAATSWLGWQAGKGSASVRPAGAVPAE